MRHCLILSTVATLAVLTLTTPGYSATPDEAKAMSEHAAAYIKQVGEDKAFADFTRGDAGFKNGELYVFCYDHDGVSKAHGANPAFVGRNLIGLKDPDGKEVNAEIIKLAWSQGQGWIDFKWPNPVTKKIQQKSAFVIRTDDVVCGVGFYKE